MWFWISSQNKHPFQRQYCFLMNLGTKCHLVLYPFQPKSFVLSNNFCIPVTQYRAQYRMAISTWTNKLLMKINGWKFEFCLHIKQEENTFSCTGGFWPWFDWISASFCFLGKLMMFNCWGRKPLKQVQLHSLEVFIHFFLSKPVHH